MLDTYDVAASLAATGRQNADGAVKVAEDIDRYKAVLRQTKPEVIVECGTWRGGSALWFADTGRRVITVDIDHSGVLDDARTHPLITLVTGNSANAEVAALVADLAAGCRTMVALDSAHDAEHVRREIKLYGPLVTPGCYLVVEDGIARWMDEPYPGSPLDAIETELVGNDAWERDTAIEAMHPVSMHPAGWWIRKTVA